MLVRELLEPQIRYWKLWTRVHNSTDRLHPDSTPVKNFIKIIGLTPSRLKIKRHQIGILQPKTKFHYRKHPINKTNGETIVSKKKTRTPTKALKKTKKKVLFQTHIWSVSWRCTVWVACTTVNKYQKERSKTMDWQSWRMTMAFWIEKKKKEHRIAENWRTGKRRTTLITKENVKIVGGITETQRTYRF